MWPRFSSVTVWGLNGSSAVAVSVPGKRLWRFQFRCRFLERRFRRFRFDRFRFGSRVAPKSEIWANSGQSHSICCGNTAIPVLNHVLVCRYNAFFGIRLASHEQFLRMFSVSSWLLVSLGDQLWLSTLLMLRFTASLPRGNLLA